MKKVIIKYIIGSQLWVSLMISCLCAFFGLLHEKLDVQRILIVFFATLTGYNFIYFHATQNKNFFNRIFWLIVPVIFILANLLIAENNLDLLFNLLLLSVFVFLYNSSFLLIKFRNISLLKIFIIAFVWTYFVLWIGNTEPFSLSLFFSVFLFIIGITIPFDISDIEEDSIKTIPKVLGVNKSKYLSCICLLISGILFYLNFYNETDFVISWVLACMVSAGMVLMMKSRNIYFYTRFWVEACSSLPLILYLIQKIRVIS